jgi:hypothetical protein
MADGVVTMMAAAGVNEEVDTMGGAGAKRKKKKGMEGRGRFSGLS